MKYWLMKSEPDVYSIDHLKKDTVTWWEGVRNYQARNFMMKDMEVGDVVLFYHSNAEPPGIVGLATISKKAEPDQLQFDKKSEYFEKRATQEKPVWYCVQVKYYKHFKKFVTLEEIRNNKKLQSMLVIQKGQRLSIQPVKENEFKTILEMAQTEY